MSRLQITQRKDETPDFVAMRAYASALPSMPDNALRAFAGWILRHAEAELARRRNHQEKPNEQ